MLEAEFKALSRAHQKAVEEDTSQLNCPSSQDPRQQTLSGV